MDEFGAGPSGAPAEEDFSKLPIEDRLKHKNWKARVSAYEELSKSFAASAYDTDPIFKPYTRNASLLKAMVVDSNAVAQEKGVAAVCDFVRYGGREAGSTRETVVPALVEKCLGSARGGTKKAAIELVSLYAENEDVMGCGDLVNDVLAGLSAKQPKVVAGCVAALTPLVRDFGPKQVVPKPILKRIPDVFAHSDKTVRAEGALLAQELHRYLGAALEPTIDSLKDIQAKELRAQFEQIDAANGKTAPTPTRHLFSQKAAAEAAAAAAAGVGGGAAAGEDAPADGGDGDDGAAAADGFDAYELAEPVDPLKAKQWPSNFDEQVKSAKWSERKEAFESAKAVLTANIKLQPSNAFDFFVDACIERVKKDATVHVWLTACQCLEAAAKGMRGDFAKYRDRTVPPLLEKLKEKKQSTVDVLAATLDAIFQTVTFSEILEDVLAATKHKNPNVKTESIRFLVRCLRTTKTAPSKGDIKPIADALLAACSDGSGDVRDAGTQGLGTLMKLIGERPMNPYLDQLDDIKKAKVQDEFAKATVKVKMGGAAAVGAARPPTAKAAPPAPASRPPAPRAPASKPTSMAAPPSRPAAPASAPRAAAPPPRAPAARPTPSAKPGPSAAPRTAAMPSASSRAATSTALPPSAPVKFRFTPEEAEAKAGDLIPSEIAAQLANANWKERLAGIQAFASWLDRESESIEAELIVRALGKKPGWKESNFQVFAEVFKVFRLLAEQCPTFGRATVALSIQPLCDKLGDIKLKAPAGETLTTYSEKTSFGFVLKQALGPLAALKAPKAVADSLLWIDAALLEFGITAVEVKSLVAHLLTCLKSANAAVRNNATTVMGTLARFLGPTLNSFLNDLNPQLKTTIEGEIEKAASNPAPAPTRFSAELRQPEVAAGSGDDAASAAAAAAAEEDALDALVPRVDIDKLIPSSALANMGDANWKVRKESLEEIQSILQANTRLKGTLSDLAPVIKLRYSDSNIMCKQLALDIAAKLAAGLGKNFEPQARNFVTPVSQCLADAKAPVRQAAATTLTAIADAAGVPSMIGGFASVLDGKAANPQLRQDLFAWLAARFEAHPPDKSYDLAPLALHAVHCLDDKLAAVKKAALATLPYIIQRAGYKFVLSQSDGMKAASKNTVVPLIDQARSAANALAPAGGAASAASSAPAATSRPGAARPAAAAAKPAAVRSLASAARPASPAMRSSSPSPASPRASAAPASRLAGGMRPPSAATRTLQAPSSRLAAPGAGAAKAGFSSRLGVAKKAVMATATSPAAAAAGSSTAPLLTSDPKHKLARERKEARGGWISAEGTARPELVETLQSQCEGHVSVELVGSMFSRDHNAERDYLSALALLADFVSSPTFAQEEYGVPQNEAVGRVVANSDLVLKYIAIRLTDNNTSISLKCFDVLGHLVDLLRTEQYHMTDYEANSILPCLIAKFGDAKVAFRDRIRDTFRKLTFIYPPSKLMTQYLDNGLPSKNARTRAECLGELGYLFSKNGLQVCTPSKTLPVIAKSISDRDTNVRTAALLALGECYKIVGDEIWSLVGRLPDKEMSLLEERLKRTTVAKQPAKAAAAAASPSSPPPTAAPSGLRAPRPTTTTRIPSGIPPPGAKSRLPSSTASRQVPVAHEPVDVAAEDVEPVVAHGDEGEEEAEGDVGEPDVEQAISEILSSEPERSTQALKAIHHEMQADAAPFAPSADQLASVLAKQFGRAFGKGTTNEAPNARLRKYLIQVASTLFDSKMRSRQGHTVASFIEKQSLGALMTQLLQRLIDTSNQAKTDEDARTYATYLNKVVIRCFGSCNLNVLYSTSFTMLGDATEDLRELVGATLETRFRFAELIIKCLWKVGRRLPTSLQQGTVEPAELLAVLEAFLQRIPPAEWKARARDDVPLKDLPLRTIKVILSHFVQVLGEDVLSHLDKLENPEGAEVYKILVRMINQSTGGEGGDEEGDSDDGDVVGGRGDSDHDAPTSDTRAHSSPSSSSPGLNGNNNAAAPPLASPPADDAANAELKDIFERISQKEQSRKAIKDLYEFQKRFPAKQPHIERSLQSTGPIFQRYIKRALANHAAEDEERADSGAGTPTSPPVAAAPSPPASTRTSQSGLGHGRVLSSESGGVNSPDRRVSSSSQATEERLAALRQKFYNRAPSSPRSTVNGGAVGDGVD